MNDNSDKNIIVWQKWVDPFGEEELSELLSSTDQSNENDEEISQDYIDEDNDKQKNIISRKNIKVIATPMGIIPITENTASGKIFNFWIGHTNFSITKKIASIIEEISGVESLDVFTRYRFRIGVGKAFSDSSVMRNINEEIYSYLE